MGRYYNKTRSPLSATLRNGETAFFAPKKWVELAKEVEGSAAVLELRRKGFLAYKPDKAPKAPAPAAPTEIPAKEDATFPKAPEPPLPEPVVEPVAVDVPEPMSPVEIVEETPVHVDTPISWDETSADADHTSLNSEVDEESLASDGSTDTESKRSKRRKRK